MEGVIDYEERRRNLAALGFGSYLEYLASGLWRTVRVRVLTANRLCVLCLRRRKRRLATQVHHKGYALDVLSGDNDGELVALCGGCHKRLEFDKDGRKRSAEEVRDGLDGGEAVAKKRFDALMRMIDAAGPISERGFWRCCGRRAPSAPSASGLCERCEKKHAAFLFPAGPVE